MFPLKDYANTMPSRLQRDYQQFLQDHHSNSNEDRDSVAETTPLRRMPASQLPMHAPPPPQQNGRPIANQNAGPASVHFVARHAALERWKGIRNWDRFLERTYAYYCDKGIFCILLRRTIHLMTFAFVVLFSSFLFACIDHGNIGTKSTLQEALIPNCVNRLHPFHQLVLIIFFGYWIWEWVQLMWDIPGLIEQYQFYTHLLRVPDADIQSIRWNDVAQKLLLLHNETAPDTANIPKRLSAHDIVNRIMRMENYLIAIFNKDLLDLSIPFLVGSAGGPVLTKVLEWHIRHTILGYVFQETDQGRGLAVKKEFLRDVQRSKLVAELQRRLFLMGLLNLLLSPFIFIFVLIYFSFKHGEELHKNPAQLSARSYSSLAKWKFRDFNELPHLFQDRLNRSHPNANKYINQFPQQKLAIIAKFISFVSGSIAMSLAVLSLVDQDFLVRFQISRGRSVLWYLGVFGMIWTVSRSFVPDSRLVFDPNELMEAVTRDTRYFPERWKRLGMHSDVVRQEFSRLFQYRAIQFLEQLVGVLMAPFVLWFSLPSCMPRLVDFFREFTVHVDGVGWVCSSAVFDFRTTLPDLPNHIADVSNLIHSYNPTAKMEQSAIMFKRHFPEWTPPEPENAAHLQDLIQRTEWLEQSRHCTSSVISEPSLSRRHDSVTGQPGHLVELDLEAGSRTGWIANAIPYISYDDYIRHQMPRLQSDPTNSTRRSQQPPSL